MKLAFIAQPYDRLLSKQANSIALIAYHTARELAGKYALTLYGKRHAGDTIPSGLPFDVRLVSVPQDEWLQRVIREHPRWASQLRIDGFADAHWQYVRRITSILEQNQADVVHVMNYWSWCRALKGRSRRKVVLEMHCEWLSQQDRRKVGEQLEAVDAVLAVSDHVLSRFRAAFPHFPGLVATVANGVDIESFQPQAQVQERSGGERRRILFVGRVSPEKGLHTLIEAFARVASRHDAELQIVGPPWPLSAEFLASLSSDPEVSALLRFYDQLGTPQYRPYLDGLIEKLGLAGRVKFLGNMPQQELIAEYRSADVLVNPSLSESFGMSVVEAMACAVPVIGTRVGGMRESIDHGGTGLLVEADAPESLARAIGTILEDPVGARAMGVAGRNKVVEAYSWQARAQALSNIYDRVANT